MKNQMVMNTKEELDFLKRTELAFERVVEFINENVRRIEKGIVDYIEQPVRQSTARFPVYPDKGSKDV